MSHIFTCSPDSSTTMDDYWRNFERIFIIWTWRIIGRNHHFFDMIMSHFHSILKVQNHLRALGNSKVGPLKNNLIKNPNDGERSGDSECQNEIDEKVRKNGKKSKHFVGIRLHLYFISGRLSTWVNWKWKISRVWERNSRRSFWRRKWGSMMVSSVSLTTNGPQNWVSPSCGQ